MSEPGWLFSLPLLHWPHPYRPPYHEGVMMLVWQSFPDLHAWLHDNIDQWEYAWSSMEDEDPDGACYDLRFISIAVNIADKAEAALFRLFWDGSDYEDGSVPRV